MNKKDKKMINEEVKKSFFILNLLFDEFDRVSGFCENPEYHQLYQRELKFIERIFDECDYNLEEMFERATNLRDKYHRPIVLNDNNIGAKIKHENSIRFKKLGMETFTKKVKEVKNSTYKYPTLS